VGQIAESNAVLIDSPARAYLENDNLTPCVRWVLYACKSPHDTASNCHPRLEGVGDDMDQSYWQGLRHLLRCETAECVCGGSKFFSSTQKLFERAEYFCSIGFPTQEDSSNPAFEATVGMLSEYCSARGFVLGRWIVTLFGFAKDNELTLESKVSIGVGSGSLLVAIASVVVACMTMRRAKKP